MLEPVEPDKLRETQTIRQEDGVILFTPPVTTDKAKMRELRAELVAEVERAPDARILFDLRHCDLSFVHLTFTLRTLFRYEAYIRAHVDRSAATIPHNHATKALCDIFLKMYTPVRPFRVFLDDSEAQSFLRGD